MSDTTPEAPVAASTSEQGEPAKTPESELADLRAALKAANKDAEKHRLRLREYEQANETALEQAQREATEYREQAQTAALEAIRFRIAAETGITDNVDLILTAPDEDTMRRQAALWVERTPTTTGPKPDLTQGGSGQPLALNSDGLEDALRSKLGI